MRYWLRFWLFAAALLAGLASILVVLNAFFFPSGPYADIGDPGYAAAFAVIGLSVGVILWRSTSDEGLL